MATKDAVKVQDKDDKSLCCLASPQIGEGAMGVRKPEDAQQSDYEDLAHNGEAVDEEGGNPADDGGFN